MVSAIALFGIAWLTATFIAAHEEFIVDHDRRLGEQTGSSSSRSPSSWSPRSPRASRPPPDRSSRSDSRPGSRPALVTGMWAGGLGGVYTLPANGTQIAAANFDLSGTTKLGTKLLDHSFFVPMLLLAVIIDRVGRRDRRRSSSEPSTRRRRADVRGARDG